MTVAQQAVFLVDPDLASRVGDFIPVLIEDHQKTRAAGLEFVGGGRWQRLSRRVG